MKLYDEAMRALERFKLESIDNMSLAELEHVKATIRTVETQLIRIRLRAEKGFSKLMREYRKASRHQEAIAYIHDVVGSIGSGQ